MHDQLVIPLAEWKSSRTQLPIDASVNHFATEHQIIVCAGLIGRNDVDTRISGNLPHSILLPCALAGNPRTR